MSEPTTNSPGRSYAAALHPAEPAVPPPPLRIVEALLFAGGQPLTAERAAAVVRGLTSEAERRSRAAARSENQWHGVGVGCAIGSAGSVRGMVGVATAIVSDGPALVYPWRINSRK